ncbi:MAG: class B sortase [Clostridiales bacterium]|nr:class B sortase [Clostridiales bacterium]
MDEKKRDRYANFYEQDDAEAEQQEPDIEPSSGGYLGDAETIEKICKCIDLDSAAECQRLHRSLEKQPRFSTWVGDSFVSGLFQRTPGKRRRRTMEKVCRRIAFSFLALALVIVCVLFYLQIHEAKESAVLGYIRQEREQLAASAQAVQENDQDEADDEEPLAILDQYAILYSMYPDVVGWVKIDGTEIDYPVMQDLSGNEYYLNHNFEGNEDSKGTPFIDADASISPLDQNLVIYGHNVSGGSQFGGLSQYLDEDFLASHRTIEFDTIYETGKYEVVAVVKTKVKQGDEDGFRYYWFRGYDSLVEFKEFTDFVEESSVLTTDARLLYGDTTIMLSTCEYTTDNGRLVIVARRVE